MMMTHTTTSRKTKPKWMRREVPVPCNCNTCYFCINGITTGIDHKKRKERVSVVYAQKNKRVKMTTCADVAVRVKLAKYAKGRYCGMCYRNQPGKCSATKKMKCVHGMSLL